MNRQISISTLSAPRVNKYGLRFVKPTVHDVAHLAPLLAASGSRACDYTVGGLLLWVDYFRYRFATVGTRGEETLFVGGVSEDNIRKAAFWLPVGTMPVGESLKLLREYAKSKGVQPMLTGVPEERLGELQGMPGVRISELEDFGDYVYDIEALASLSGKKLGKKRNHVNRFMNENPGWSLEPIDDTNLLDVQQFYDSLGQLKDTPSAVYESIMTHDTLRNLSAYPFEARLLRTLEHGIVAFAIGEVSGDTLHVHIEKCRHDVEGSGETINKLFASAMLEEHPELRYVNRQDDAGDPGLRQAKLSYNPAFVLKKYNVFLA